VTYAHRTVTTTSRGLLALADWLTAHGCTHVAIEATGVYGLGGRVKSGHLSTGKTGHFLTGDRA